MNQRPEEAHPTEESSVVRDNTHDYNHADADAQDHPHADDHDHPHADEHDHPHADEHDHPHPHSHGHDHGHEHGHSHGTGVWGMLSSIFHFHGHSDQKQALVSDSAFSATNEGIRTVWIALALLGVTTVLQIAIVYWSGSVALLADTIHNFGDALNSIPLLIAFYLARRVATRRYTYGFARSEDVAGILIVVSIAVSAAVVFWESFQKLLNPQPMTNLGWVAVAGVIGFLGNEGVALLQIRVGRKIGSAAMVADGMHARTDGFTSLAVVIAALATWLGFPIVDPIIGILIGIAILFITWDATKQVWYRLMDAVDPALVDTVEQTARGVPGVVKLGGVRVRWIGHSLQTELSITVDEDLPTLASYQITEAVRHALFHALPRLSYVNVSIEPCGHSGTLARLNAHHEPAASA
jgi:cation diffusion facilitator family transporter